MCLLLFLQSVMLPASDEAQQINRLFNYFAVAAAFMFFLVTFLVIYICIKFKRTNKPPIETTKNSTLETLMIGGPLLIVAFFFYQTIKTMHHIAPSIDTSKPDVIITGHQWWWEAQYPESNVITANEIHLPVGKKIIMEMRSADVIHDWWVPELGNKIDLIPGQNNYLSLTIQKPGVYTGTCSEFCGAEHAWMRIKVVAENENEFNKWLSQNSKNAAVPEDTLAISGAKIFQQKTCADCHQIKGTPALGVAGPDLTHLSLRSELLTGILKNNEANLFEWINDPQKIKPLARMPSFILSRDSVKAIAHYLSQLN